MTAGPTTTEGEQLVGVGLSRVLIRFVDGRVVPREPAQERQSRPRKPGRGGAGRVHAQERPRPSEAPAALEALVCRLEAAAAALEGVQGAGEQPDGPVWLTHEEVCERLRVHPETVKAAMLRSEGLGLEAPWVNVGSDARPRYRWRADEVDAWWAEVHGSGKARERRSPGRAKAEPGRLRALLKEGSR